MNKIRIKHKQILISIVLFLFIFIIFGFFKNWWFFGADDFHKLYLGYKTKTWKDLLYFFYEGHTNQGAGPSNFIKPTERTNFFNTLYRPFHCIFFVLRYWLFGTWAYPYFLLNIFFHALNTVILFNIFLSFINYIPSFLLSLFFAFHPQIAYRFGAAVNFHYYVNVFFTLFLFLSFKKHLDTKKYIYLILSCIAFTLSLFTREVTIVLPIIIFLGTFLYINKSKKIYLKKFIKQTTYIFKKTFFFFTIALGFIILRAYLYSMKFILNPNSLSFIIKIKKIFIEKIQELKIIIFDIYGLSWLPWGHKIIRGIILISLISITFVLFIRNKKKLYVVYFFLSGSLILWPSLIGHYNPRYIYEAYPFILLGFIFLFKYSNINLKPFKKISLILFTIFNIFLITFIIENFSIRENKYHTMHLATKNLINNQQIKNRALCFFGWPIQCFGDQNADIFWILLDNPKIPIYFDTSTGIMQKNSNLIQNASWRNISSNFYNKNYLKITPIKGGFNFKSTNPQKVIFDLNNHGYSLGKKIINKKEIIKGKEVITDFNLIINKKYLKTKPLFIKWDYKKKKFKIIKDVHKVYQRSNNV